MNKDFRYPIRGLIAGTGKNIPEATKAARDRCSELGLKIDASKPGMFSEWSDDTWVVRLTVDGLVQL